MTAQGIAVLKRISKVRVRDISLILPSIPPSQTASDVAIQHLRRRVNVLPAEPEAKLVNGNTTKQARILHM
jgi:hypothetical protein